MSTRTDSYDIMRSAENIAEHIDELDRLLTDFQIDLDTNDYMREELDWDYCDLRKTLDKAVFQVKALVDNANCAYEQEDEEEN